MGTLPPLSKIEKWLKVHGIQHPRVVRQVSPTWSVVEHDEGEQPLFDDLPPPPKLELISSEPGFVAVGYLQGGGLVKRTGSTQLAAAQELGRALSIKLPPFKKWVEDNAELFAKHKG